MTQPSQPERSEPHTLDCQCVGCAYGFTKIIAELEAEVARLREACAPFLKAWDLHKYGGGISAKHWQDFARAFNKEASPPAPVAQEKPPEVDEPAIVQRLRDFDAGKDGTMLLTRNDVRRLLPFIDSRKATVSEFEAIAERACHRANEADRERDRLRGMYDNACKDRIGVVEEVDEAKNELSALKARPVVDVASARADVEIAQEWLRLIQRDAPDVAHGPSQQQRARDALRAVDRALESLQPASAKADEKCPRCGGSCFVRDLHANGAKVPCPECQAPMPSAEPSRVDDGQQERRLDAAWDQAYSLAGNSIRNLVEYLRAEREGRKA